MKLIKKIQRIKTRTRWLFTNLLDDIFVKANNLCCPICDFQDASSKFKPYRSKCIFKGGRLVRHECPCCGVIFGTQRMLAMSEYELSQEYKWHYSCYDELGDSTEKEIEAFYLLNPSKDKVYLNYGCGRWNKTIESMRSLGYNLYGFEPHSATVDDPFIINDLETIDSMKFDGIISNNVLEHLRYPGKTLAMMASLLKSDGAMIHRTPCYRYECEGTRFHLYFFTGNSLNEICFQVGLAYNNTSSPDMKIFYKKELIP